MAKKRLHKYLITLLKISVSIAAIYFVFSRIEYQKIWATIQEINAVWIIPAIILFVLSKTISSFRLNVFFRTDKVHISEKANLKLYLLGMFYNLFLPGGIGGDAYKIYLIKKNFDIKTKHAFRSVLFDRLSGVIALGLLVVALAHILPIPSIYVYILWILIPVGIGGVFFIISKFFSVYRKIYFKVIAYSLFVQLFQLLCAYFLLLAFNIQDHKLSYLFVFLISSIIAMIPFTIGGFGAREMTFLIGSQLLGLRMESAIALSLLFYLITMFVSFFGIYFSFVPVKFNPLKNLDEQ